MLAAPAQASGLDATGWTALLTAVRAERLLGTLAHRLDGLALPDGALHQRRTGLWDAEMARRALAPLGCPVVLLKGPPRRSRGRGARSAIST